MDHVSRLNRCISTHTDPSSSQTLLQVSHRAKIIPVCGHPIWSGHSASSLHRGGKASSNHEHSSKNKNASIPRRLDNSSSDLHKVTREYRKDSDPHNSAGVHSQLHKIQYDSVPNFRFCGLSLQPKGCYRISTGGQNSHHTTEDKLSSVSGCNISEGIDECNWTSSGHRKASAYRPPTHETFAMAFEKPLESSTIFGPNHPITSVNKDTHAMVVPKRSLVVGQPPTPSSSGGGNIHRRISRRLGCPLPQCYSKRHMGYNPSQYAHKLARTESNFSGTQSLSTHGTGKNSTSPHRQCNSCFICKQARGHPFMGNVCPLVARNDLVYKVGSESTCLPHCWTKERNSRHAVKRTSEHKYRMVSQPDSIPTNMSPVAHTNGRHICNSMEQETTIVHKSTAGPRSGISGCDVPLMVKPGCLCISTNEYAKQSNTESPKRSGKTDSDNTMVAKTTMDTGSNRVVNKGTNTAPMVDNIVDANTQQAIPPASTSTEPACMAHSVPNSSSSSRSDEVEERIRAPQRRSTRKMYDARVKAYKDWCEQEKVPFNPPSTKVISKFLLDLFKKGRKPNTLEGYRSAIADHFKSVTIGKDPSLSRLLSSFHRDRPKALTTLPPWDLRVVLEYLMSAPFEPMALCNMKYLTLKTVFLLALASGNRRSEIHAWTAQNVKFAYKDSHVSLEPCPTFLAKNQVAKEGPDCFQKVVIPSLKNQLDSDLDKDKTLCPIRALKYYLDRTQTVRGDRQKLFISFKPGFTKEISPSTISSWLKSVIVMAYKEMAPETASLFKIHAHQIRGMAASWALLGGVSVDQVLKACHWRSHNTFTEFYLKPLTWSHKDQMSLGPFVAAQNIILNSNVSRK